MKMKIPKLVFQLMESWLQFVEFSIQYQENSPNYTQI